MKVGSKVTAKQSGWIGTVIAINPRNSSPYKVRWHTNGITGKHNDMTIKEIDMSKKEQTYYSAEAETYFKEQGYPCTVNLYNGGDLRLYWSNPITGECLLAEPEELVVMVSFFRAENKGEVK